MYKLELVQKQIVYESWEYKESFLCFTRFPRWRMFWYEILYTILNIPFEYISAERVSE